MNTQDVSRRAFMRTLAAGTAAWSFSYWDFAPAFAGQGQQQAPTPIETNKITNTLAMLSGDGGNVGVLLADDSVLMIDSGLAMRAADIVKVVGTLSPQKIAILFNTHFHFDHVGANEMLGKTGTKIMAHENVKKVLSSRFTDEAFGRTFEPLQREGIPVETYTSGGQMIFGKEKVVYKHVTEAHTDGDTYVFFSNANVLHTGDLFWNGLYPVIDYSAKGWIGGMVAAADEMYKVGDANTRIIPGHGPLGTKADLKAFRDMLAKVQERLEPMVKQGKTIDEVVAAAPTKDLDDKWGTVRRSEGFLRQAYPSLVRRNQRS
jgi:glyoxylase-like metal-dependent hydrolase (beta-lactamase superfamily II)